MVSGVYQWRCGSKGRCACRGASAHLNYPRHIISVTPLSLWAKRLPTNAHAGQNPMTPVKPKPAPLKATIQFHGDERKIVLKKMMARATTIRMPLSQPGTFLTKNAVLKKDIQRIPGVNGWREFRWFDDSPKRRSIAKSGFLSTVPSTSLVPRRVAGLNKTGAFFDLCSRCECAVAI